MQVKENIDNGNECLKVKAIQLLMVISLLNRREKKTYMISRVEKKMCKKYQHRYFQISLQFLSAIIQDNLQLLKSE